MAGVNGGLGPDHPATAVDFVAGLKRLKERSGLTFRQLEERAAASGDLLPRSTIADVLRRPALPRADLVAAFVRACGGTPDDVTAWLAARERLAGEPPPAEPAPPPARGWFRPARVVVVAVAAVAVAAATGAWMVVHDGKDPATEPAGPSPTPPAWVVAGPVRIHPVGAPDLCVTEGVDRSGRYHSAVAAQRPCAEAEPPLTRIEPVRDSLVFITWTHQDHGVGCLTLLVGGPGRGLVEPQENCQPSAPTQLFHIERSTPDRYRIRSAQGDLCLGIRGDDARVTGAEVVPERCAGATDQEYAIEPRA